ncbi:MAG: hypothetical protein RLZZ158_298 [Cyanobacteriota bacterium]|jgi:hypothetical protein
MKNQLPLLLFASLLSGFSLNPALAVASPLLESVKQNKQLASQLCGEFRRLNAGGQRAHEPANIRSTAASQGLSTIDAEILTTYVVGMYCPDVR